MLTTQRSLRMGLPTMVRRDHFLPDESHVPFNALAGSEPAGGDERIDPAFDLSPNQLNKMVDEAMAGADFSKVIDVYFQEIEDRVTDELMQANSESDGGYNLSSGTACRFLAERIVNNILRPPHKEEEAHGTQI
jgi:hypothetical protein